MTRGNSGDTIQAIVVAELQLTIGRFRLHLGSSEGTRAEVAPDRERTDGRLLGQALRDAERRPRPRRAADAVARAAEEAEEVTAAVERANDLVGSLAKGLTLDPKTLETQVNALIDVLDRADRDGRFDDEIRLARSLVALLALVPRWIALAEALQKALAAARAIGDQSAAAWAHHELGTFALAADDAQAATSHLSEALRLREQLGDEAGAEVTLHNLGVLHAAAGGRARRAGRRVTLAVGAGVATLLLLAGTLAVAQPWSEDPPRPSERQGTTAENGNGEPTGETTETVETTEPVNEPPEASGVSLETAEEQVVRWTPAVRDGDDDALRCRIAEEARNGAGTVSDDCAGGFYTPDENFSGTDSFVYEVSDGKGGSTEATVSISVEAVNDAPLATNVTLTLTALETTPWKPVVSDADDEGLKCSIEDAPDEKNGKAEVDEDCERGLYTPGDAFEETDSFSYRVEDGNGGEATATVTVTFERREPPILQ